MTGEKGAGAPKRDDAVMGRIGARPSWPVIGIARSLAFVVPTLRREREGRGTHCGGDAGGVKSVGHPRFSIGRRQPQFSYQRVVPAVGMDEVKDRFSLYQDERRGTLMVSKIEELQCRVLVAEVRVCSGMEVR